MNYIISGDYKIYRRIGIGDIQHVRSGLMQVAFFDDTVIYEQLSGALIACEKLNMRLRAHINAKRLRNSGKLDHIINFVFGNFRNHDIIEHTNINELTFNSIMKNADTIIIPEKYVNIDKKFIIDGLIELWKKFPRPLIEKKYTEEYIEQQIKDIYPEFFNNNLQEYWNLFSDEQYTNKICT